MSVCPVTTAARYCIAMSSGLVLSHCPFIQILENYLNDLPNPIASAKTTFKDEFPEVSDEMTRVEEQVAAGKSLGKRM